MKSTIYKLQCYFEKNRKKYLDDLNSGASKEAIRLLEEKYSIELPSDFKEFYYWRNGQGHESEGTFKDNMMFMPVEDIIYSKEILDDCLDAGDFEIEGQWSKSWIPFMTNGGGSYICLDVEGLFTGLKNQIVEFWKADYDRPVEFPSIKAMVKTYVSALESGYFSVDENGQYALLEEHHDDWDKLQESLNPGYPIENDLE